MKVAIRTIENADIGTNPWGSYARFRPIADPLWFRAHKLYWHSAFWRWLESHPLANELHRWVAVDGDQVVGHLAAVPLYYRVNRQRVVAHTPADYRALPKYGFHALSLLRTFFRTCQNCVTCDDGAEVIKLQARLGAEPVGQLQYATKLLDVSGLPVLSRPILKPITSLLDRGSRAVDEVLMSGLEGDLKVGVLEGFDESFDELFEKIAAVMPCVLEKDAAFLNWRYGPGSPQAGITILGAWGQEGLLGYALLLTSEEDAHYIVDLTTLPGRRDVSRALLKEAVRHFRQIREASAIRYWALESPTSLRREDLWRLGFFFREDERYTLMAKFADSRLHRVASDSANWAYSIGDSENNFWLSTTD